MESLPYVFIIILTSLFFVAGAAASWLYFRQRQNKRTPVPVKDASEKTERQVPETAPSTTEVPPAELEILRGKIDNLYIVNELGRKLTSSLDLQESFRYLFTTLNSMMDAAFVELCVYDETTGNRQVLNSLSGHSGPVDNAVSTWCYENNREVLLSDAENDYGRYVDRPLMLPGKLVTRSVLCFPVQNREVLTGTLCIANFRTDSFEPYHADIVRLLLGYVGVAIENAMRHAELNRTKERAERSEKFKELFLANMSHEIRTPINAVTGMTRLLLDKEPRNDQLKYLESIRNASDSLLVIVNDILDLSKIEAGKIELEQIDFSLRDLAGHVHELMRFKAEEKGLVLETFTDEKLPPVFVGDPTRLTQVLINLSANAVKFTSKGKVSLRISPGNKLSNSDQAVPAKLPVMFEVTDTGIGMSAEEQSRLFRDYAQAGPETARKYGGTGLGLSISRRLVELQGGKLEVQSREGKGTTFSFTLDFPVSPHTEIRRTGTIVGPELLEALRGKRVLLADDNEYNRIVVGETLQVKAQMKVDEARDGYAAVEMAAQHNYDLILMDLVMPGLDGFETHKKIRQLPSPHNGVPVVALTASVVQSEIARCYEAGMNGFIPKPFRESELFSGIAAGLGLKDISPVVTPPVSISSNGRYINLQYLEEFTGGDPVRMQRHIHLFFSAIPAQLEKISAAISSGKREDLRIAAHNIKSPLRAAGVSKGVELAEYLETQSTGDLSLDDLKVVARELEKVCQAAMEELRRVAG